MLYAGGCGAASYFSPTRRRSLARGLVQRAPPDYLKKYFNHHAEGHYGAVALPGTAFAADCFAALLTALAKAFASALAFMEQPCFHKMTLYHPKWRMP